MTQDEIIALAEQAGMVPCELFGGIRFIEVWLPEIDAFAKLVAQAEREACANICETLELPEWPDKVRQPLAQAIRARGQA